MRFLSVCSGIEAASVAWSPLSFECVGLSEIDPFARAVLSHRYPEVPLYGDFTRDLEAVGPGAVDLLVGGTPCQSFSVAGLRAGLGDERGNLALEFVRLAARLRPEWVLWENVPGVRSADGGRGLGSLLGALAELGYGWAYRSLDAQYFGVPQRRERVFVVGCLGGAVRAGEVLFEREGMPWDPAPRRAQGAHVARAAARHARADGFELVATFDETQVTHPENRSLARPSPSPTLAARGRPPAIAWADCADVGVRRLTPRECERLMGFPDDWTQVPWRNGEAPDSLRYKAIGNSIAVPVLRWIGQRLVHREM